MQRILFILLLLCAVSFAEETSAASNSFGGGVLVDVSAGTHWADYNISIAFGTNVWNNTFFMADMMNLHVITDIEDSTSRVSGFISMFAMGMGVPLILTNSDGLAKFLFGVSAILNPTIEYALLREKFYGVSLSAGYKTDWFAFSPDHALYFKPHAEINADIFILRISASYAYVVTNTYDIKRGPRFYLKMGLVFYSD